MGSPFSDAILAHREPRRRFDYAHALRWARQQTGRSALRQVAEIAWLRFARGFSPVDYYHLGFYRTPRSDWRQTLSARENAKLNRGLNPRSTFAQHDLIDNKVLTRLVLDRCGFPVPRMLAVASTLYDYGALRRLDGVEQVLAFLAEPGVLPCFAKPVFSSRGFGAASLIALSPDGTTLTLGDGRAVPARRFVEEVLGAYPEGYVFEDLVRNEPGLEAVIGTTTACPRLVTVLTRSGPRLLYAVLRVPAPGAMSDTTVAGRSSFALLDAETGWVVRVQDTFRISADAETTHPVTGARLVGQQMPDWTSASDLVLRAHRLFGAHGLLGWDVFFTERGPLLNEVNYGPLALVYQRASGRGLLNPDFAPILDETRAVVARIHGGRHVRGPVVARGQRQ